MWKKKPAPPTPVEHSVLVLCTRNREDHPSVQQAAVDQATADAETDKVDIDWSTFQRAQILKEGILDQIGQKPLRLGPAIWAVQYTYQTTARSSG